MKKTLLTRLRTHHRTVINWIGWFSATCVTVRTAFLGVEEVVPLGAELGELLYDAGLAYLTAWLFHQLVIVLPEAIRADRLARVLAPRVDALIELGYQIAEGVNRTAGVDSAAFPPDLGTAKRAVEKAAPDSSFPGWGDNWSGVLLHITRRAEDARRGLKPFYPVLDQTLLEVLESEEREAEKLAFALRAGKILRREHLRDLASPLHGWLAALDQLLNMRRSTLAAEVQVPRMRPKDNSVLMNLDQIESDFNRLFFNVQTDKPDAP